MSRILRRVVTVSTGRRGRPLAYRYGGGWHRVGEVLDEWVYRLPWWERSLLDEDPGEAPERVCYRVKSEEGELVELQRWEDGLWRLYRTFD